ncbi:hypothetical protein [Sphingomonas paeninsulae]|nr:hypothetical protein [Sphingomonas paeninsulae]
MRCYYTVRHQTEAAKIGLFLGSILSALADFAILRMAPWTAHS